MNDFTAQGGPCLCGCAADEHVILTGEMTKYGSHLCYGKGDGGWPGYEGPPCECREYRPVPADDPPLP